jgi:outer membrane autotransporter protein
VPGTQGNLDNAGTVVVGGGNANVAGDYHQATTGTLSLSLGSELNVGGTATIDGGTLNIYGADSGYVTTSHQNLLTATNGVTGTFDSLTKATGVFLSSSLQYDANDVWINTSSLSITTAMQNQGVSLTPASASGATLLQGAFDQLNSRIASGGMAGVSSGFLGSAGAIQRSPDAAAALASLQSLSGQLHAASAAMTFQAIDASNRALSNRFDNLLEQHGGYGMWVHGLDEGGAMARSGFNGVGFQLNGWIAGSDRRIGRSGVAGFAFGQSNGQQSLDQSLDRTRSRSTEGMMYAGWMHGNWYTEGRVGFGQFRQSVNRRLLLGNTWQGVWTDYSGRYSEAYAESGLRFDRGDEQLTPFMSLQYTRINRDGFSEQGANGFGLRSQANTLDRWQSGLGVRASHHLQLGDTRSLDLTAHVEWQHTLAAHGDVFNASFVGLQQWQPLTGVGLSRDSGLVGVGLNAMLSRNAMLKFGYDYQAGQHIHAQSLTARFNLGF